LSVSSCCLLGEGFDNLVYLINDALVFRFPRRFEAVELIRREIGILTRLIDHVTLKIPHPTYIGQASALFPRPFYGHPLLKGRSGSSVKLSAGQLVTAAKTLARFLRSLHGLDIAELYLNPNDLKPIFDRADWPRMKDNFIERLGEIKQNYPMKAHEEKISNILSEAEGYQPRIDHKSLIQGDLYHRHLLFDEHNRLDGVIDWGDACVGDSVADLGIVYQFFPKSCHQDFFSFYGDVPIESKKYARFLGIYYAIALLWFGHDRRDQDLIHTSLWTIENI
jgi:aminoglycoside phosphotransferase (APT) family kinase protein